jgi:hypothetical protein
MLITRFRITALATLAALGVLAAVALSAGGHQASATTTATTDDPAVEVRTEVAPRAVRRSAPAPAAATPSRHRHRDGRGPEAGDDRGQHREREAGDDHGGRGRGGHDG